MKNGLIASLMSAYQPEADHSDKAPAKHKKLPTGPFGQIDQSGQCSLLIFTPRNAISALIDLMTGHYGYSHLAIDCGELDIPSGKRVMIEATQGEGVHHSFQDEYGDRKFVRISLENTGVIPEEFCNCIRSKLGEKFDYKEALMLGLFDNPAKQICSDLATVCLPEAMQVDIARAHQACSLQTQAAVRYYGGPNKTLRLFVSPNGFAEYFGAPKGEHLHSVDQLSQPVLQAK